MVTSQFTLSLTRPTLFPMHTDFSEFRRFTANLNIGGVIHLRKGGRIDKTENQDKNGDERVTEYFFKIGKKTKQTKNQEEKTNHLIERLFLTKKKHDKDFLNQPTPHINPYSQEPLNLGWVTAETSLHR